MLRYLQAQWTEEGRRRVYVFNSFFMAKLMERNAVTKAAGECAKADHARVKKWTKVCGPSACWAFSCDLP